MVAVPATPVIRFDLRRSTEAVFDTACNQTAMPYHSLEASVRKGTGEPCGDAASRFLLAAVAASAIAALSVVAGERSAVGLNDLERGFMPNTPTATIVSLDDPELGHIPGIVH